MSSAAAFSFNASFEILQQSLKPLIDVLPPLVEFKQLCGFASATTVLNRSGKTEQCDKELQIQHFNEK